METVHYLRTLLRQWWLILITLIAGGVGGFLIYHSTTPLYQSSIQLIVSGAAEDRAVAGKAAVGLSQIAETPPAIDDAKLIAGFPGAAPVVTSSATGSDPFLTVAVADRNPQVAQAIANAYSQSLPATSLRLQGASTTPLGLAVVSPAELATAPFSPNPYRDIGLGLVAGLVLGITVAFLRDALNRTVRDSEEVERLTGLTSLGTVPRDSPKKLLPVATDPRGFRAEAYRQIRTSVGTSSGARSRTFAVTSASSGEGKTSVATNVAAAFSRAGHRVAIVDADLRRPQVAHYFGVQARLGLTNVLSGEATLDDALSIRDNGRLAILTSGRIPANPSEALSGVLMEQVMKQLAAEYEYVFFDTPPVLPVTDALVLAPKVDAVILVVRLGSTTRDRVRRAMASLGRVHANILGVVPNQAGKGSDRDYRYRYRYAYSSKRRDAKAAVDIAPEALQAPVKSAQEPASAVSHLAPEVQSMPAADALEPQPAPVAHTLPDEPAPAERIMEPQPIRTAQTVGPESASAESALAPVPSGGSATAYGASAPAPHVQTSPPTPARGGWFRGRSASGS